MSVQHYFQIPCDFLFPRQYSRGAVRPTRPRSAPNGPLIRSPVCALGAQAGRGGGPDAWIPQVQAGAWD